MNVLVRKYLNRLSLLLLALLLAGCSFVESLPFVSSAGTEPVDGLSGGSAQLAAVAMDQQRIDSAAQSEGTQQTPVTGARVFLNEARFLLENSESSFDLAEFQPAEFGVKEAQRVLFDADLLIPSRTLLETEYPQNEEELIRHEALLRLRGEFENLWNRSNILYDQLLPYLDTMVFESGLDQDGMIIDLEAMNDAMDEAVEPAPGSWQEIKELLLQMSADGQIDIEMGLEDYPDSAWKRIYSSLSYYVGRGNDNFRIWLERSGRYQLMVEDLLVSEGLPKDMVFLCMIESGFSPRAFSRASAVGPWQFMSYTAQKFGLETSAAQGLIDERRDFTKSTIAASAYLKILYEEFQSWPLAMAAYNSGEGRVRGARRWASRNRRGLDYWAIFDRLPRETRNYVPYFLAAMVISKNTARFGFTDIDFQTKFEDSYETVHIPGPLYMEHAAKWINVPETMLVELNPQLRWRITPRDGWELRLPRGTTDAFITQLELMPEEPRVSYVTHMIRSGDTGGEIAEKWGVAWSLIREHNNIRSDRNLRVGTELRIPKYEESRYLTEQEINSLTRPRVVAGTGTPIRVRVRSGNTISGLATRYGVTWVQIRGWNNLRTNTIYIGQTLTIYPRRNSVGARPAVATANLPADGVYTIGRNDTLWDISRKFKVSVADLKKWNGLTGNTIYPGRKLIITEAAARQAGMGGAQS